MPRKTDKRKKESNTKLPQLGMRETTTNSNDIKRLTRN